MLLGPAFCCRAVERKLRFPPEEIWITDATLAWAFQRLCLVSRPSRRNGTSVPGPMECRRRLGRRRMTHFSEAVRPPIQDFASLWGIRDTKGSNSWQWEAPSPSPPRVGDATDQFPAWLTNTNQSTANNPKHRHMENRDDLGTTSQSNAADDLKWFRDSIRSKTNPDSIMGVSEIFCQSFKQSLSLGQVSATILAASIREIPRDIRNNTTSKDIEHTLCISFYQAVWEGIMACKVLRPAELDPKVLRLLLTNLPRLPVHISGALIADVLTSITDNQKCELKQEIYAIANSLFAPLVTSGLPHPGEVSQNTRTTSPKYSSPQNGISLDIKVMEDLVGALINSFQLYAPDKSASNIRDLVRLSTTYATKAIFSSNVGTLRELKDLRKAWLKFIARLPFRSEDLLVQACMIIEARDHSGTSRTLPRLSVHDICDILFEYWASRIPGTSIIKAHAAFRTSILGDGSHHDSVVHLCRALKQQSTPWHKEIRCLLLVLRRLRGSTASSYFCLKRLEEAKIYLDAPILADEITALSSTSMRYATYLQKCYSKGRPKPYAIPLEHFPGLAVAMINDPSCNPDEIWHALGGYKIWKEERTNKARIHLVRQMAFEFSQTKSISTRVALRNVARCHQYLSQHKVPISNDIARILADIGIERNILEKGSISGGRLRWVLDIISKAEGEKIARRIEIAVISAQCREKERRRRDNRRLKSGPID